MPEEKFAVQQRASRLGHALLHDPGGGDSVRRRPEFAERVLPHGGGDQWASRHLPGTAEPLLPARGRSPRVAR